MLKWWHRPSVRLSLTLWHVAAMVVVLAAYGAGVFAFVSGRVSTALDDQLRDDFRLAAATADRKPDGTLTWFDDDREGGRYSRWLQVWTHDGHRIFRTGVAERNPIPESEALAARGDAG